MFPGTKITHGNLKKKKYSKVWGNDIPSQAISHFLSSTSTHSYENMHEMFLRLSYTQLSTAAPPQSIKQPECESSSHLFLFSASQSFPVRRKRKPRKERKDHITGHSEGRQRAPCDQRGTLTKPLGNPEPVMGKSCVQDTGKCLCEPPHSS